MFADYYYRFSEIGFWLNFGLVIGGVVGVGFLVAGYFKQNNTGAEHETLTSFQKFVVGTVCVGLLVGIAMTNDSLDSRTISFHDLTPAQKQEEKIERALGEREKEAFNESLP